MDVTDGSSWSRAAAAWFLLLSGCVWFLALFIAGMACDDVCETGGRPLPGHGADWRQYADATQWTEIAATGWATLLLAVAVLPLLHYERLEAATFAVLIQAVLLLRLGVLEGNALWLLPSVAGAATVLSARPQPRRATSPSTRAANLIDAAGALTLGWLISVMVGNAETIAATLEFSGAGDAGSLPFESWATAGLCAAVLVGGAIHVVTGRPSRVTLRLAALTGAFAALLVAWESAAAL